MDDGETASHPPPPMGLGEAIERLDGAAEVYEYMVERQDDEWSVTAVSLKGTLMDLRRQARALRAQREGDDGR